MSTAESLVLGASRREAAAWAGVAGTLFVGTLLFASRDGLTFGEPFLIALSGSLLGSVLAAVQAWRNGSVALSWFLTGAPVAALVSLLWLYVGPAWGVDRLLALLVAVAFVGTTAHLFGVETAEWLATPPRRTSRTERLGLVAVLLATGGLVLVGYVAPIWLS